MRLPCLLLSTFHHIACSRYGYFYRFLLRNNYYDNILLSDVRDVIFQDNPFKLSQNSSLLCVLEHKKYCLGSEPGNAKWIREAFGDEELSKISHCRISCSGTTLGSYQGILNYLAEMITCLAKVNYKIAGYDGFDQGVHNYLLWNKTFLDTYLSENGKGPILTMHGISTEEINLDSNGFICNDDGTITPVLHQYDRHPHLQLAALKNCNLQIPNSK